MKKYVKLFAILFLFSGLSFGFMSCNDDEPYDYGIDDIVTINKIGDNEYDFTLDNGKKLFISQPKNLNLKPKYDRAIINYYILSEKNGEYDYSIQLNQFIDVLTKAVIYIAPEDEVKQDSIGNNPIKVHSMWEGGGYLNVYFGYNAGGSKAHLINLVSAESDKGVGDEVVELEFRHNQNGDPANYGVNGYVSFDLKPYKIEGRDKVTFEISWIDISTKETKTKTIEYKIDGNSSAADVSFTNEDTNLNIY